MIPVKKKERGADLQSPGSCVFGFDFCFTCLPAEGFGHLNHDQDHGEVGDQGREKSHGRQLADTEHAVGGREHVHGNG